MSFTMRATVVLFQSSYFYCNLKSVKSIIFPLNFPFKLSGIVVLYQSSLHFLCCSTNLTFHVKLLFFTPTYFIHFLSWQSYFTEESLCDWNRYEIKLCFKIFVGAVFLSSSLGWFYLMVVCWALMFEIAGNADWFMIISVTAIPKIPRTISSFLSRSCLKDGHSWTRPSSDTSLVSKKNLLEVRISSKLASISSAMRLR